MPKTRRYAEKRRTEIKRTARLNKFLKYNIYDSNHNESISTFKIVDGQFILVTNQIY